MTPPAEENILSVAYINIRGQTGLSSAKQDQIETFILRNKIDILHLQEINISEDSFSNCNTISSSYNLLSNNSPTKYGTASLVRLISSQKIYFWIQMAEQLCSI